MKLNHINDKWSEKMKIYLISQCHDDGYDTYDSAVVVADTEEEAKLTHPSRGQDWDGKNIPCSGWCDSKYVEVKLIGQTDTQGKGVICSSFNAG
jgi:hypothetical protein